MQVFENCVCNKMIGSASNFSIKKKKKRKNQGKKEKAKQHRSENFMGLQAYSAITGCLKGQALSFPW